MGGARVASIRRALTATPLARRHESLVSGRVTRRLPSVAFASFNRARHPEPALRLAEEAFRALARGEYQAVHLFARLASAATLNGVPLNLVLATASASADEARHADYAMRMAEACAGEPVDVALDPDPASLALGSDLAAGEIGLEVLDLAMVTICAIAETMAAALLRTCAELATDPVVRPLLRSIAGDEIHHARIGWFYLTWRSPQWSRAERQRAADRAGALVADSERGYWIGRDAPRGSRRAARGLGILDTPTLRRVAGETMVREIVPALDALGLGGSHAWRVRARGGS